METTLFYILGSIPLLFFVFLLCRLFKNPCLLFGHHWEVIDQKDMSRKNNIYR